MRTRDEAFRITCIATTQRVFSILGVPDMQLPDFKLVHRTGSGWGGLCAYYIRPQPRCVVSVQKSHTVHERNLERIVAHEIVHHVIYMTHGLAARYVGHGPMFMALAAKVNAVLGDNFVTKECDDTYERPQLPRPVTLVLWRKVAGGRVSVSWYSQATERVARVILGAAAWPGGEVRVIQSRDASYASSYPKTSSRHYGMPLGDKHHAEVDALWERATVMKMTQAAFGLLEAA